MGQVQLEWNQNIMGNYTFSKQENDFSIFKNNVYGTVSPPVCIPSGFEGTESFCRPEEQRTALLSYKSQKREGAVGGDGADGTRVLLRETVAEFSWEQQVCGRVAREFCKYSRRMQDCDGERGTKMRARPGSQGMGPLGLLPTICAYWC